MSNENSYMINVGDRVLSKMGKRGEIKAVNYDSATTAWTASVNWEDGSMSIICQEDKKEIFQIGKQIFGNLAGEKEIEEQISNLRAALDAKKQEIESIKEKLHELRFCRKRVSDLRQVKYPLPYGIGDHVVLKDGARGTIKYINLFQPPYPAYGIALDGSENRGLKYCGEVDLIRESDKGKE